MNHRSFRVQFAALESVYVTRNTLKDSVDVVVVVIGVAIAIFSCDLTNLCVCLLACIKNTLC